MTRIPTRFISCLAVCAAVAPAQDAPQDDAITIGHKRTVHSDLLGEDRPLWIWTPSSYESGNDSYPVLYLLDGPTHFHHTTGVVDFLAQNGRMPQTIVVAIANTDRTRDLTPHSGSEVESKRMSTAGGADRFLEFLTTELSDWVEANYRTKPSRILVGHSFGGLFGVHALVQRSDFFKGIIAISPSMQWGDQELVGRVETWLDSDPDPQCSIYMTVGSEGSELLGGTMQVAGLFSDDAPASLRWKFVHMPSETHMTVPHRSTYDGLEFLYEGYWLEEGSALAEMGGWESARRSLLAARKRMGVADDPISERSFGMMAFGLVSGGRTADALVALREPYPERDALPPGFWFAMADFLAEKGEDAALKDLYGIAVGVHPGVDDLRKGAVEAGWDAADLPAKPAGVEVSAERLAQCVGSYEGDGPVSRFAITQKDGKLWVDLNERGESRALITKSADRYMDPQGPELLFGAAAEGGVSEVTLEAFGSRFTYHRVGSQPRRDD